MTSIFRSKKEVVYDLLREDILRGKYKPGSRLIIDELALTLGRQPDTDPRGDAAARSGWLRHHRTLCRRDRHRTERRLHLRGLRAAGTSGDHQQPRRLPCDVRRRPAAACRHDRADGIRASKDPSKWSSENKAMHLFICQCANTTLVLKMMEKVLDHWDRLRLHYLNDVFGNRIQAAQEDHKRILAAFYSRDPDEVERVIHDAQSGRAVELHPSSAIQRVTGAEQGRLPMIETASLPIDRIRAGSENHRHVRDSAALYGTGRDRLGWILRARRPHRRRGADPGGQHGYGLRQPAG